MDYYVYHLIDPRCGSVFYVGKGARGRIDAHERAAKRSVSHPKCDRIRAIWESGREVTKVRVKSFADEAEAFKYEAEEIDRIGLINLTNLIAGGGGVRKAQGELANHSSQEMIGVIARIAWMEAKGLALNQPWQSVLDRALPTIIGKLIKRFGEQFVSAELGKHGVIAKFSFE